MCSTYSFENANIFNSTANFTTRVAIYIQKHRELLEDPDYIRLYSECMDFFNSDVDKNGLLTDEEKQIVKKAFEISVRIADSDQEAFKITKEEVDELLEKYKIFWKMQEDGVFDKLKANLKK